MKNVLILSSSPRRGGNSDSYAMSLCKGRSKAVIVWKRFFCETRPFTLHGMRRVQPIQEALSTKR